MLNNFECKLLCRNVRSLINKGIELSQFIYKHNIDVIAINETTLKKNISVVSCSIAFCYNAIERHDVKLPNSSNMVAVGPRLPFSFRKFLQYQQYCTLVGKHQGSGTNTRCQTYFFSKH